MIITKEYIDQIIDAAKQVESEDEIDWGMLPFNEDDVYNLIGSSAVTLYYNKYDESYGRELLLATIVKLLVENFTLNVRLKEKENGSS